MDGREGLTEKIVKAMRIEVVDNPDNEKRIRLLLSSHEQLAQIHPLLLRENALYTTLS